MLQENFLENFAQPAQQNRPFLVGSEESAPEFIYTQPNGAQITLRRCNAPRYGNCQLYCSEDGRFFSVSRRTVSQVRHNFSPSNSTPGRHCHNGERGCLYPIMRHFGGKMCHILMYEAWHGSRAIERATGYDPSKTYKRPIGEVDHINGNVLDYRARNLELVTPSENKRRALRLQALRTKMGMDTSVLVPEVARDFLMMPQERFDHLIANYKVVNPADLDTQEPLRDV